MKKYKFYSPADFSEYELILLLEDLVDIRLKKEEHFLFKLIVLCVLLNTFYFIYLPIILAFFSS